MSSEKLRGLILGYGAVGIIKSFHLERSGKVAVSALARSNFDACRKGIRIESSNPKVNTVDNFKPTQLFSSGQDAASQSYDFVLISTKCVPDVRPTSELLKPFITQDPATGKTPAIVLLQNGIGIESEVQAAFPTSPVLSSAIYTTTNAHNGEPYTVVNGALNRTVMGLYQGEPDAPLDMPKAQVEHGKDMLSKLADALNTGGWETEMTDKIFAARYAKNLWNCSWGVVNAIARAPGVMTSATGPNKDLTVQLVSTLLDELLKLSRELGLDESDLPSKTKDTILGITLNNKFPPTFKPSIQLDLEAGNLMEVEPIVGFLAKKAESHGLHLPYLQYTYTILRLQQNFIIQGMEAT